MRSLFVLLALAAPAVGAEPAYDVLIRNATIYDGTGARPRKGTVALRGDKIAAVGDVPGGTATLTIDADGLAVAPGFINMLSWSNESLIYDGRGQSEVREGVTLQVLGEGWSMGPLNDAIRARMKRDQTDFKYDLEWRMLAEYLYFL